MHEEGLCALVDIVVGESAVDAEDAIGKTGKVQHLNGQLCRRRERAQGSLLGGDGFLLGNDQKGGDADFCISFDRAKNFTGLSAAGRAEKKGNHGRCSFL